VRRRQLEPAYEFQLQNDYDFIIQGQRELSDWNYMTLKTDMKEGTDYVLVSRQVWYVFKAMD
jgi:hypothetical protein